MEGAYSGSERGALGNERGVTRKEGMEVGKQWAGRKIRSS
jgi:hypothetical protein